MSFMEKLFGNFSDKELKRIKPIANKVLELEPEMQKLTDEELQAKTPYLKEKLKNGASLDDILPEAFAVCREADWRVLGLKPYPVQIIGGIVLHRSCIAEMQTGEGKTRVATMPVYLNALTGEGVHVVTVNDYLAKRDSEWMGKVYRFLGLTVGLVIHDVQPQDRRKAYLADVTYGTNNEFGFDCGYTDLDTLRVTVAEENYDLYIIEGERPTDIVHQFRQLVGRSYIPPKWAFGATQSRWSYMNEDEVREVVANYRTNNMPLDAVVLDIDYMERYKDFTVDEQRFPHFADFAAEMKAQGIRLVPIIDAGVKIEDGYDVYEEGVKNGYFCTNQDGTPFVAGVWPGRVHFPDMLNPEARAWFGSKYKFLLNQGIEGFWNDMNEPAIFYSEETLKKTFAKIDEYRTQNLDISSFFAFKNLVAGPSNNENDYKLFYHNTKQGRMRHDKVHNIFGYNMTRAAGEAFEQLEPDKRILMYSRSACIGMHRYGGIWTGDNQSWWSHILLSLHMMPSLNMCGFLYEGPDIGGFGSNTTEDLVLRWYGVGIFSPLLRNHSAAGTRKQEPYRFKNKAAFAGILQLRYLLLPYIYSEYMKAALRDGMYCMPLAFAFPDDDFARQVEDEVMIGESLLIAPVYEQNARGRYVYLPEEMLQVRVKCSENDRMETTVLPAGHHYIPVELDEVVFFVRKGHILPIAKGGEPIQNVASVDFADLRLLAYAPDGAAYEYYTDDGETKDYDKPEHFVHITLNADGNAKSDSENVKVEG